MSVQSLSQALYDYQAAGIEIADSALYAARGEEGDVPLPHEDVLR